MKRTYITPLVKTIELGEELCQVGLNGSNGNNLSTPGNDTNNPVNIGDGFLNGDERDETDPA